VVSRSVSTTLELSAPQQSQVDEVGLQSLLSSSSRLPTPLLPMIDWLTFDQQQRSATMRIVSKSCKFHRRLIGSRGVSFLSSLFFSQLKLGSYLRTISRLHTLWHSFLFSQPFICTNTLPPTLPTSLGRLAGDNERYGLVV
jgi:hypothetical protein